VPEPDIPLWVIRVGFWMSAMNWMSAMKRFMAPSAGMILQRMDVQTAADFHIRF
jgi:hypothetical protein